MDESKMSDEPNGAAGDFRAEDVDESTKAVVRRQLEQLKELIGGLSLDDVVKGDWFPHLLAFSLSKYKKQVNAEYFELKYPGLPADAIAARRIDLASRYATVEGGLSAGAYTAAVAATIGSAGGASPLTLPAGGASFVIDLTYTSQLQLQLAYDLAVIYRVPLDLDDPEDLWKLIRVAFGIKAGEVTGGVALRGVPVLVRPIVKKLYSQGTLAAAKSLPVIGKHLLQRNVIKFAIPAVGVPLSTAVNYWTTRAVGEQAKRIFRHEAGVIETAERIVQRAGAMRPLVGVLWYVAQCDGALSEPETLLIHHVTRLLADSEGQQQSLADLKRLINVERDTLWEEIRQANDDRSELYQAAVLAATADGKVGSKELDALRELAVLCSVSFDEKAVQASAKRMKG